MTRQDLAVDDGAAERAKAEVLLRRIALVAILAIALGIAVQGSILAIKLAAQRGVEGAQLAADFAQGITWSLIVCAGVSLATTVMRARPLIAGVLGLIFAPIAIALAKASQKMVAGLTGAIEQEAALSLSTISVLRAVQYGVLAWMLGKLVQKGEERLGRYIGAGVVAGVLFGAAAGYLTYFAAIEKGLPAGVPLILTSLINEVIFPIGCSMVIYGGQLVGRSAKLIAR